MIGWFSLVHQRSEGAMQPLVRHYLWVRASTTGIFCRAVSDLVMHLFFVGLNSDVTSPDGVFANSKVDTPALKWHLANVRGLRQGRGELRARLTKYKPEFFALTETHLKGDPLSALIPSNYKVVARLDRSLHGGSLLLGCKNHLLVDVLDLSKFSVPKVAEMVGAVVQGVHYILCYTPSSQLAPRLFEQASAYMDSHPDQQVVWMGDFNAHHPVWLNSASPFDAAGEAALEFSELYGVPTWLTFQPERVTLWIWFSSQCLGRFRLIQVWVPVIV